MRCLAKSLFPLRRLNWRGEPLFPSRRRSRFRSISSLAMPEDARLGEFLDYMEQLKNYERLGVPKGAGTDSDDGFDLGRMRRLLQCLGNPHTHYKAVHIAGTKGKGSTAAFLANILREEGYSIGCYTSPHLLTIRERISLGKYGEPVSAEALANLFHQVKGILDRSIELEDGALTHFEVLTALAFSAFSKEKVDLAIIEAGLGGARDATNALLSTELAASVITSIGEEHLAALGGSLESIAMAKSGIIKHGRPLVICGPFQQQIESIFRDKASLMSSPIVSACDPGIHSVIRCFGREDEKPYQICDIFIKVQNDLQLFIELPNIKMKMLGNQQLKNAVTATCTALCIRNQGWTISDRSIRAGLERTNLPGRSQFLTQKEAEAVGLFGASLLIDGAHTKASAEGLANVIKMASTDGTMALIVSMASDKDHAEFAKQFLSGRRPDIVLLTETSIAGSKSRTTSASTLKNVWIRAASGLGIHILDIGTIGAHMNLEDHVSGLKGSMDREATMLIGSHLALIGDSIKVADRLLRSKDGDKPRLIVVTGSLHIVASVLAAAKHG